MTITPQEQARNLYITLDAKTIASQLCVSEPTVRRWVKGIKKPKSNKYESLVNTIYPLATRRQGISASEENNIYKDVFGYISDEETGRFHINISKSQKQQIRTQARTKAEQEGKVALFVPDWVSLRFPRPSFNRMLQMTNDLYERMQEYISEYMVEFEMPKEARYAVEQQLLVMLVPKYSPRNIYDVCSQAAEVVDQLEWNMDDSPNKKKRIIPSKPRGNLTKENTEVYSKDLSDVAY